VVVDAEVKKKEQDHSQKWMEKCARQGFDRADTVRDVWLPDFHDRSLSRGQRLSRRASEERGCKFSLISSPRVLASRPWFLDRTRLPFAWRSVFLLPRRLSLCFPASLETYQREHWKLALLRPVGLTARPGRLRAEEISLFAATCYAAMGSFQLNCEASFLALCNQVAQSRVSPPLASSRNLPNRAYPSSSAIRTSVNCSFFPLAR
jgi:hypothetical protein